MSGAIAPVLRNRRAGRLFGPLGIVPAIVLAFFLLPLASLAVIAVSGGWASLPRAGAILGALRETGVLLAGTAAVCLLVAVPLAWAVSRYEFPLRRLIELLSVLHLALPAYLAAYAYVSLTDHFGPLQTGLRALSGAKTIPWFPDFRSMAGACFVMGMTLFPYVYLPARWSFERQSARQIEAARNLGATGSGLLWRIALPLAWPAIIAGLSLALLETLNDIGATQYLGVNSLTVLTFNTWTMRDNLAGSAQLALLLLVGVAGLIVLERRFRKARRYADPSRHSAPTERLSIPGAQPA
jgi:iron(III) transport system permease protein